MMRALAASLVALLLVGTAQATYGPGDAIEAKAPVLLGGRTDGLVGQGVASFVGSGTSQTTLLTVSADELTVVSWTVSPCTGRVDAPLDPLCASRNFQRNETTLRDARVVVAKTLSPSKVLVSNRQDDSQSTTFGAPGSVVTATGATTLFGANRNETRLSPYEPDWTSTGRPPAEPVFSVPPAKGQLSSQGGTVRATGSLVVHRQASR